MDSFGVGLLPRAPISEVVDLAVHAEELGFGSVWVADSQSIFRDAYAALALTAARTSKIHLATGVTNPVTRHPAVIASSLATLDELSGGRAILGLGVGESAVRTLGLRPARLKTLEETTHVLRTLMQGQAATYQGKEIKITWAKREVPIYFGSSGPRSLQLAGRVADGVLFQVGAEPSLAKYAVQNVAAGARQAGRDPKDIRLYMRLACSVSDDRRWAREEAKGYVAAAAGTVFTSVPREHMPDDLWTEIKAMKERYDYLEHASSAARHKQMITDRILEALAITGTPSEAVPRFKQLLQLGIDGFVLPITTSQPRETMRTIAEKVLPHLI